MLFDINRNFYSEKHKPTTVEQNALKRQARHIVSEVAVTNKIFSLWVPKIRETLAFRRPRLKHSTLQYYAIKISQLTIAFHLAKRTSFLNKSNLGQAKNEEIKQESHGRSETERMFSKNSQKQVITVPLILRKLQMYGLK